MHKIKLLQVHFLYRGHCRVNSGHFSLWVFKRKRSFWILAFHLQICFAMCLHEFRAKVKFSDSRSTVDRQQRDAFFFNGSEILKCHWDSECHWLMINFNILSSFLIKSCRLKSVHYPHETPHFFAVCASKSGLSMRPRSCFWLAIMVRHFKHTVYCIKKTYTLPYQI